MSHSDELLEQAVDHDDALKQLEAEAAASGRRLAKEDLDYLAELKKEGDLILSAADTASKVEARGALGRVMVADPHGILLTEKEQKEVPTDKRAVAGGGRLAD